MIAIDSVLLSDDILEKKFVCDLNKCKGSCCEVGDTGATLQQKEVENIEKYFPLVRSYLSKDAILEIETNGFVDYSEEVGWVTPTVNGGICVYAYKDSHSIIHCSFETVYNAGLLDWKKPISCHLYPIKVSRSKVDPSLEYLNYQYIEETCKVACSLGETLQVPVYRFLKEAIVRQYGINFYNTLENIDQKNSITN